MPEVVAPPASRVFLPADILRVVVAFVSPPKYLLSLLRVSAAWHAAVCDSYYFEVGLTLTMEPSTSVSYKECIELCGFTTFNEACAYLTSPHRSLNLIVSYFTNPAYPLMAEYHSVCQAVVCQDDIEAYERQGVCPPWERRCCKIVVKPDFGVDNLGFSACNFFKPMTNFGTVRIAPRLKR